jgi:hypothetical protein
MFSSKSKGLQYNISFNLVNQKQEIIDIRVFEILRGYFFKYFKNIYTY